MESDKIKKRNKRTVNRKLKKEFYDSLITLSTSAQDKKVRLLDEGMFTYADGTPDFYMMKGTLEKFLNGNNVFLLDYETNEPMNITSDYVGTINLGHKDFESFPYILGEWKKEDLSLVDNGDGRKGLDVVLHLDEDSVFVKELKRMPYTLAVSAEFDYHINDKASEELGILTIDEIFVKDFAIVGDGGNVGSNDIELNTKGDENKMSVKKNLDVETPAVEEPVVEPTVEEPAVEEPAENPVEEPVVEEPVVETPAEEPVEEPTNEETKEGSAMEQALSVIESLKEEVKTLTSKIEEQNKELSAMKKADADFAEKFKQLTVEVADDTKEVKEEKKLSTANHIGTDGIGE